MHRDLPVSSRANNSTLSRGQQLFPSSVVALSPPKARRRLSLMETARPSILCSSNLSLVSTRTQPKSPSPLPRLLPKERAPTSPAIVIRKHEPLSLTIVSLLKGMGESHTYRVSQLSVRNDNRSQRAASDQGLRNSP